MQIHNPVSENSTELPSYLLEWNVWVFTVSEENKDYK